MADVKFLGVGRRSEPDPDEIRRLVADLFPPELLDGEDLVAWYAALTDRIALVEAALEVGRTRRAQVIAHLHDTMRLSYSAIADRLGGIDRSRAAQLAAKGRPHIRPLDPSDYGR